MISIVISEKGGAERRQGYDATEISIGRVKGNDVLLPKGNVSKRHARLICRDGRYIVTDLKSTNGTYVNHRRITHATLVREGDRIYIGDFVLRIDNGAERDSGSLSASLMSSEDPGLHDSGTSFARQRPGKSIPPELNMAQRSEIVSHFPIEHDPDESSPDVPAPPRLPPALRTQLSGSGPGSVTEHTTGDLASSSRSRPSVPPGTRDSTAFGAARSSVPDIDRTRIEAQRQSFEQLMSAVEGELGDIAGLDGGTAIADADQARIRTVIDSQVDAIVSSGQNAELDALALKAAAVAELLDVGPLGPHLADEQVSRISLTLRQLTVVRRGHRITTGTFGFSSEDAVARAVRRLCRQAGENDDTTIGTTEIGQLERQLGGGRELFVVRPPTSGNGHLLVVRKRTERVSSLNQLVRNGTISRGMATLLAHCVAVRANLLVVASPDAGGEELMAALAAAAPRGDSVLHLQPADLPPREGQAAIALGDTPKAGKQAVELAARVGTDHMVVPAVPSTVLLSVLDAVSRGTEGIVQQARAHTLRQAWTRLAAEIATERPGLSPESAREWIGATFDLGLEVTRLRDNRLRVVRLSEFRSGSQGTALRDIFTFAYHRTAAGGSIEGSFYASGTVPRIVEDLAARGMPLDTSIFRRHPSG